MRQIAMDDAEAALLRERDRHVRFGDGVHGGADDGNIQADVARELRLGAGLSREQHRSERAAEGRHQK